MADITLGQVAYEAFLAELTCEEQANFMVWEDLPEHRQAAWQSAAAAAVALGRNQGLEEAALHMRRTCCKDEEGNPTCDSPETILSLKDKEVGK